MSNRTLRIAVLLLFLLIFCGSSFMAAREIIIAKKEAGALSELADIAAANRSERKAAQHNASLDSDDTKPEDTAGGRDDEPVAQIAAWYDGLLGQNGELFGWIEIPETNINYPVMHTPSDPEKYLHTAFDGSYSKSGVPFLAGECYEGCGNMIIYGHNMRNGSMFHDLLSYKNKDFWREHPIIYFDTINDEGEYEIIAAFRSKVYRSDETGVFKYYNYTDLSDPEVFAEYVAEVKAASLYDTGLTAEYGDTLITLSTCGSGNDTERFVVVARKK